MIATIVAIILVLCIAAFIIHCICAYTIGGEWTVIVLGIIATAYHAYLYYDAFSGNTKKMSIFEIIFRCVQQVLVVIGLFTFFDSEELFDDAFNLLAFAFAFVLAIVDAVFYVKQDIFYKTERHTYVSDTKFDVSVDERKNQVEVKPHIETTTYFDEQRIITFIVSFVANRFLPVIHIFLRSIW